MEPTDKALKVQERLSHMAMAKKNKPCARNRPMRGQTPKGVASNGLSKVAGGILPRPAKAVIPNNKEVQTAKNIPKSKVLAGNVEGRFT